PTGTARCWRMSPRRCCCASIVPDHRGRGAQEGERTVSARTREPAPPLDIDRAVGGALPRLAPLRPETTPALREQFEAMSARMGFIPNSVLIMQRSPALVRAFVQMAAAIWDPTGTVDVRLKRLISHVASRAAGCRYCMAHTAEGAVRLGV